MNTAQEIWDAMCAIMDRAAAENRDITQAEVNEYDRLERQLTVARHQVRAVELNRPQRNVRLLPGGDQLSAEANPLRLRSNQRLADLVPQEHRGRSFGKYVRGILTGNWNGADEERALSIGSSSAGGYLVPTPLAANVIDAARNQSRVFQAGALTVPMTANTLKLAKVLTDPTPTWHSEAGTITPTDGTFGVVTLTARTLVAIVKFSRELFEDVDNLDSILTNMFASAFALELDRVCLYGSGVAPEPSGLTDQISDAAQSNVSMGANGAVLYNYDPFIDAIYAVQNANFEPNAAIYSPRTQRDISKLVDDDNAPFKVPESVANLTKLVTKQVSDTRTQGSSSVASDIFVGQWDQLLVGLRSDFSIQMLTERYVESGEFALAAWLRGDVMASRIAAFCKVVGIIPPA